MQKQLLQMQMAQIQQQNAPDPYLEQLKSLNQGILNWHTNSDNTAKDIYKHPTLGSKLPIFQMAKAIRDKGRIGRGIAGVGENFRPMYAKELAQEDSYNRGIAASGMLETGLQNELQGAEANQGNLVMMDTQRRTSGNSMIPGMQQQLTQMMQGGWSGFFKGLLSQLGVVGSSLAGQTGGSSSGGSPAAGMASMMYPAIMGGI